MREKGGKSFALNGLRDACKEGDAQASAGSEDGDWTDWGRGAGIGILAS